MSPESRTRQVARRFARGFPPVLREMLATVAGLRPREPIAVDLALRDAEARIRAAVLRHERAWARVDSPSAWERFRDRRIEALRAALDPPRAGRPSAVECLATSKVEGVVVENLTYAVRDGMQGVANLYRPATVPGPVPAIVVVHSHHTDGTHRELRDMGIRWAKAGCIVLVPTLSGYGERRLHPFAPAPVEGRGPLADRQDYFFRYNLGLQLTLAGRSLLGWMVEDLVRALDLLAERPDVDRERVVMIGSVAGGGDIAGAVAALDPRVRGLVCFGYGPVPGFRVAAEGDDTPVVPGLGPGTWDTTRNPARVAIDGFLPWVVLASIAPRPLLYAHEFAWTAERDPVWQRLRTVYALYGAGDDLAAIHGRGSVEGSPPDNTHCTHVGRVHRQAIHPVLERWFGIAPPDEDDTTSIAAERLRVGGDPPDPGRALRGSVRGRPTDRAEPEIGRALESVVGCDRTTGAGDPVVRIAVAGSNLLDAALGVGFRLRLPSGARGPVPAIVGFGAHDGRTIGNQRAALVRGLVRAGCAVALADLRGCGPSRDEAIRGRHGRIQAVGISEWMLGDSLSRHRLRDLSQVLDALARNPAIDAQRIVLWGESIAPSRKPDEDDRVRFDAGWFPEIGEPAGGLLALMAGALDRRVRAVVARGTLARLASTIDSPYCFVPTDWIVPGLLDTCEIDDLVAAIAPRAVYLDALIDGRNRPLGKTDLESGFERGRRAFRDHGRDGDLLVAADRRPDLEVVRWIVDHVTA